MPTLTLSLSAVILDFKWTLDSADLLFPLVSSFKQTCETNSSQKTFRKQGSKIQESRFVILRFEIPKLCCHYASSMTFCFVSWLSLGKKNVSTSAPQLGTVCRRYHWPLHSSQGYHLGACFLAVPIRLARGHSGDIVQRRALKPSGLSWKQKLSFLNARVDFAFSWIKKNQCSVYALS